MPVDDRALAERASVHVGATLAGKWRVETLIGAGATASVYAARHRNGKRVAIKILHRELGEDPDMRRRFLQEAYAANRIGHPGVVAVLDNDQTDDGCAFLVMEYLEGNTAGAVARGRVDRRLSVEEALAIAEPLAGALAAAHEGGIVHRDVKPDNLFLTRAGELKVLDFGLARVRERALANRGTQTGTPMGTPAFMPPEQARGDWAHVDARSDVWSASATIFTLITGRLVHPASTVSEALVATITSPAPKVASVWPAAPRALAELLDRGMAYARDARFADGRELHRAIVSVREALRCGPPAPTIVALAQSAGDPVESLPTMPMSARRRPAPRPGVDRRLVIASIAIAIVTATTVAIAVQYLPRRGGVGAPASTPTP